MIKYGMIKYDMIKYDMIEDSMVWYGMVYIVLQIAERQARQEADWSAGWGVLVIRKREGAGGY